MIFLNVLVLTLLVDVSHPLLPEGIFITANGNGYLFMPSTDVGPIVPTNLGLTTLPSTSGESIVKYTGPIGEVLILAGGTSSGVATKQGIEFDVGDGRLGMAVRFTDARYNFGATKWRQSRSQGWDALSCGGLVSNIGSPPIYTDTCEIMIVGTAISLAGFISMPLPVADNAMVYLDRPLWPEDGIRGHMISFGGIGPNGIYDWVYEYAGTTSTDGWKSPSRLPTPTHGMSAVAVNENTILTCGGSTADVHSVNTCYMYYPDTMYLTGGASMVIARYRPILVNYNNIIYAIGGTNTAGQPVHEVEYIDYRSTQYPTTWTVCQTLTLPEADVISGAISLLPSPSTDD